MTVIVVNTETWECAPRIGQKKALAGGIIILLVVWGGVSLRPASPTQKDICERWSAQVVSSQWGWTDSGCVLIHTFSTEVGQLSTAPETLRVTPQK